MCRRGLSLPLTQRRNAQKSPAKPPTDAGLVPSDSLSGLRDDSWTSADDALLHFHSLPDGHPVNAVRDFVAELWDESTTTEALSRFVTPESVAQWGGFGTARRFVREDPGIAIGGNALRAVGAHDVVYIKVVDDVGAPEFRETARTDVRAWVTLVWRPELASWRIHAIGEQQIDPATLPRTSPGIAPAVG